MRIIAGQRRGHKFDGPKGSDTRPTSDLAYAHAYGAADEKHGNRFMASIYGYPKPDVDPATGQLDYQSVHAGFAKDPDRWGTAVLDFIRRNGVQ